MTSEQAIQDARIAAGTPSVFAWGACGFLVPLIAVLVAVARKPAVDATALAKHDDKGTETIFSAEYIAILKKRQVGASLTGACVWLLIFFVLALLAVA